MKWLYKLEYKYSKFSIPNLMTMIVAGMAIVYVLDMVLVLPMDPPTSLVGLLSFSRAHILAGEVWRVLSFVFVPPNTSPIFILLLLFIYYQFGRFLEQSWGAFRFTLYYLIGILGAIAAGFISGSTDNYYLNMSLFLAFATLMPDAQFRIYFIIPVKGKWMLLFYAVIIGIGLFNSFTRGFQMGLGPVPGLQALIALAFSLLNYFLFFGRDVVNLVRDEVRIRQNRRNWQNRNR